MTRHRLAQYLDELGTALELRDTPQDRVDDVLRQVRSHLADIGEDPQDAFGDPVDHVRHFAPHRTTTSFWLLVVSSLVLTVGGGLLFCVGVIGVVGDRVIVWGLDAWVGVVVGLSTILAWAALIVATARRHRRPTSR